jgi:hypothetical protein
VMVTLDLQGLPHLTHALQQLMTRAAPALQSAIEAEADRILEASYPLVPVDTGALVSSGTVLARPDGAEIRYGNHGQVPYALIVHEDTTMNHPRGGQHHYLSAPFFAATDGMTARLAADLLPLLRG